MYVYLSPSVKRAACGPAYPLAWARTDKGRGDLCSVHIYVYIYVYMYGYIYMTSEAIVLPPGWARI